MPRLPIEIILNIMILLCRWLHTLNFFSFSNNRFDILAY